MNKFVGIGNFVRDPELRQLSNGVNVAQFTLVFNTYKKSNNGNATDEACFIDCVAWDSGAEAIAKSFKKGDPIVIDDARLILDSWETKDGQKRSKIKIRVGHFSFPPQRKRRDNEGEGGTELVSVAAESESGGSDIPF